ncbi:unnamed protein product [Lactuca saligna]|uniref:Transposase, Ptta/En/Spm, plant n=1 Tax=Lactuca saligna TaxID=75948 RepID=A0AA35YLF3_LACSI|nr:unnamed protein product [Lactuca saligna]
MSKRGGRGKRGGLGREDGRRTTPYKTSVPDTIFETEQESDSNATIAKRGITCGKGARKAMKASKKRLPVEFNFVARRVICNNESAFTYECGYILRKNCSLQHKEWRLVPKEEKFPLRHKLTTLFDIDVENENVCKVIDSYMARSWRNFRAELHKYFKEIGGPEDPIKAKTKPPSNIRSKEDWEYLCDMWCEPKYMEIAKKKVVARGKRKMETRNGLKSTIRYHVELGHDVDSSSGHIETWRLTHWDEKKGWKSTDMAAKYEEMKKMRNEHSLESMIDRLILEKVLGRSSICLFGWGRDPVVAGNIVGSTEKSKCPSYDELVDELETIKREHEAMKQILIEKNIMPPPLSTSSGRSHGDTSECGTSNHTHSGQSHDENMDIYDDMQ